MGYIYNKEELNIAKEIIKKYSTKTQTKTKSKSLILKEYPVKFYIEDILYNEFPSVNYIKKIILDNYQNENIEFIEETFFILENFKIETKNQHWGYTFYIYTKKYLYYANGLINKQNKYFTRIALF